MPITVTDGVIHVEKEQPKKSECPVCHNVKVENEECPHCSNQELNNNAEESQHQ